MEYANLPPKQPLFSKKFYDSGLLTLSALEILETEFIPFKNSAGEDSYYFKGVSYSKIRVPKR